MFGKAGTAALALCAASVLAFGVGSAGAAVHGKKPLCRLGEPAAINHYADCTANPAFAKTICSSFVPALQQVAAGASINQGYFPHPFGNGVGCFYEINGHNQAAYIGVGGGASAAWTLSTGKRIVGKAGDAASFQDDWNMDMKQIQEAEAIQPPCPYLTQAEETQSENTNGPGGIAYLRPQRTTVGGYQAFTWDGCQTPHEKIMLGNARVLVDPATYLQNRSVTVLAGDFIVQVTVAAPGLDTGAKLVPLAQQLIAKYKPFS